MNATHIKILAVVTMVIDHVGIFLLPQYFFLRVIGRFSFPLFAWLIANGATHTKNGKNYLLRIGALALISQAPYLWAFRLTDETFNAWNIFLTLFLGLTALLLFKKTQSHFVKFTVAFVCSVTAIIFNASYGASGVLAVIICYIFKKNTAFMMMSQFILFALFYPVPDMYTSQIAGHSLFSITPLYLFQPFGSLALIVTAFYNNEKGRNMKYFFYFFYPVHLLILYALKRVFF